MMINAMKATPEVVLMVTCPATDCVAHLVVVVEVAVVVVVDTVVVVV